MTRILAATLAAAALAAPAAHAGLAVGAAAPDFTARGALGGKPLSFTLSTALKKGPVVLYFFPAAFTSGCTIEAHEFSDAAEEFSKMGATLIGITAGNVARVAEFSVKECRSKFAVAADPGAKIAKTYSSTIPLMGVSDRTSYVITPDDKVALSYTAMSPNEHVAKTMAAVKSWRAAHPM